VNGVGRKAKPESIEVIDSAGGRFVIATYADGSTTRRAVEANERPKRKPRKPFARARNPKRDLGSKAVTDGD
jgi:hypothetical protein